MPYPNYWAARVRDADEFERIVVIKTTDTGILIKGGPLKRNPKGPVEVQTYWFPKKAYTKEDAIEWLKNHSIDYKFIEKEEDLESLHESIFISPDEINIDEENKIVKNVCVCSHISKNGYFYSDEAQKELANLIEGYPVYYNHKERISGRDVRSLWGKIENPRFISEAKKSYADIRVIDAEWDRIKGVAKLRPKKVGLSIEGKGHMDKNANIVTSVKFIEDISLVHAPATTENLFEETKNDEYNILQETINKMQEIFKKETSNMTEQDIKKRYSSALTLIRESKMPKSWKEYQDIIDEVASGVTEEEQKKIIEKYEYLYENQDEIKESKVDIGVMKLLQSSSRIPDVWKTDTVIIERLSKMDEVGQKEEIKHLEEMAFKYRDFLRGNKIPIASEKKTEEDSEKFIEERKKQIIKILGGKI